MKSLPIWISLAVIGVAFFFDTPVVQWMEGHRVGWLDPVMIFLTDFGLGFGLLLFVLALFEKHLFRQLILVALALVVALESAYLLKLIFRSPRPFETWAIEPLTMASDWSFPSAHAAFIFASLPFFSRGKLGKWSGWLWGVFAVGIAFSRIYVGVHYLSDVVAGALLGYGLGTILLHYEEHHDLSGWILKHLRDKFEVRRQVAHIIIGSGIAGLYALELLSKEMMLWILVAGGLLSLTLRYVKLPLLTTLLDWLERPPHRDHFPGRGSFFMVLGSLTCMVLFPKPIALGAIMVMTLGDSITHLFGRYRGRIRLPYNHKKTLDGAAMGTLFAILGAMLFVPFSAAILGSVVAMFVETLDTKLAAWLDDNVVVPLVAGGVMWALLTLIG